MIPYYIVIRYCKNNTNGGIYIRVIVWYSMGMKRKVGLELYGPCGELGAGIETNETVATVDDNGRVTFHRIESIQRFNEGRCVLTTTDGERHTALDCYLVYTAPSVSKLKDKVRKMFGKYGTEW
jgi:hypothetical protein